MIGDFNAQIGETHLDTFLYQHELANINKELICYKNSENPSCVDFIWSNRPKSFSKTNAVFTGFSAFHKLFLSVLKTTKWKPNEITYRNFKKFSEENLNEELRTNLQKKCVKNNASFESVFLDTLNADASPKKKVNRANHAPYVTNALRKAIMKRSNLRKIYLKKRYLNL